MKVLIAIVTRNRLNLLKRCIEHINNQSHKDINLYIINNGSTDQTNDFLLKSNINHLNQKNLGSAGGWNKAIEYALLNKYDGIWLMDDDGFPEKDALSKLILNINDDIACISSVVIDENNKNKLVFPMPLIFEFMNKKITIPFVKIRNINLIKKINKHYPFLHLFNGALIAMKTIKYIGNVNMDYFLYGDEVDYLYRLNKYGKVITLTDCIHYHPNRASTPISSVWIFYMLKNSIINNYIHRKNHTINNLIIILATILRIFLRNGSLELFNYTFGKKKKFFYQAIILGYRKTIGKNLPK